MSLDSNCDLKEYIINANKCQTKANKFLQLAVRLRDDEMKRLDQFEHQFKSAQEMFEQYRKLAIERDRQAKDLTMRLQKENDRDRRLKEHLESDIARLKKDIEGFSLDNDRLEKEFKENVDKLQRLKSNSGHNIVPPYSSPMHMSNENSKSFIQRLRAEESK